MPYRWKSGDTEPIEAVLYDGAAVLPLTGATVTLHVKPAVGVGATQSSACTVLDAAAGRVRFQPPAYFSTPGLYYSEFDVVFAPGTGSERRVTVPNGNAGDFYDQWEVLAQLA